MIRSYLLCLIPLAACNTAGERADTGLCPAGETCSPVTPHGLHFRGAGLADDVLGIEAGPLPIAIGGTQEVGLEYDPGDGRIVPLDLGYAADDDGGLGVTIDQTAGPVVTVRGVASRTNYLRITDPADGTLFDRYALTGAALERIALVAVDAEVIPADLDIAWAAGGRTIGIALYGEVQHAAGPVAERLTDTSLVATLAGSTRPRWDAVRLASATPGHHTLTVTAGDKPAADLDVQIVDGASAVAYQGTEPATIHPGQSELVCFSALADGRFVSGLTWTFRIDGGAPITQGAQALVRNCVDVDTGGRTSGTISVVASAGGQSTTLAITIAASAAPAHGTPGQPPRATAGDRAAM